MKQFELGVSLNNRAAVFSGSYHVQDMIRMSELAEDMSLHSVWVGDSLINSPRYESIAILAAVASRTTKIKLGCSVIQPHFRHPIILALSWATLDQLSNGRTILALGTGGGTPHGLAREAELLGFDMKSKGNAIEENFEILRRLWNAETLNLNGKVYSYHDVRMDYYPVNKQLPIWIAAGIGPSKQSKEIKNAKKHVLCSEDGHLHYGKNFERAARLADGWITHSIEPSEFGVYSRKLGELALKNGRDPNKIARAIECWFNVNENREIARIELSSMMKHFLNADFDPAFLEKWSIYGSREDCIKKLEAFRNEGADLVNLVLGSEDQLGMLKTGVKSIMASF